MSAYATLNLPIVDWDGEYFAVVPAKIIHDLAPHLAHVATFAVHRSAGCSDFWVVSHVETGGRITSGKLTREEAVADARAVLALHTPRAFAVYVRRAVKCNPEIAKRDLFGIAR